MARGRPLTLIAEGVRGIGYRQEAIVRDYTFADVLDPANTTRTVALAAFTQTPPSYRSAALAAVPAGYGGHVGLGDGAPLARCASPFRH